MKPPVETVRISSKGKELLSRVKRHTGIDRWNEICRRAFCRSLSNPTAPTAPKKDLDSAIEIEWKTFAGEYSTVYAAIFYIRQVRDGIEFTDKKAVSEYFRAHLERGLASLQKTEDLQTYVTEGEKSKT